MLQMDSFFMLLCCYQSINVAYELQPPYNFAKLVDFVCTKYDGLSPGKVLLFYKIPGYNNFALQNDVDMQNMVCLARSFRLQLVDMVIEYHRGKGDCPCVAEHPHVGGNSPDRVTVQSDMDIDDEVDLLPTFCPNNDKVFLSHSWATGFTHIGQGFKGGALEFHNVLLKYAVECGFQFKYKKNDSLCVTAVCAMLETNGCTWFVHACKLEANRFFYLRKWNSEHICGVAIRTSKNSLVGSELVSDIISQRVRDQRLTSPTEVILDLKQDYGLDISYRIAWLGVEKARGELFGAHNISFDQLRWCSDTVMAHSPGNYIKFEYDDHTHRFTWYFISFKACINGFNYYRPFLFLDATFLKGRVKGFLLVATANDGKQG
ncbi:hypothetical protein ACSBR1_021310 [Camellia fascicularis]